MSNLLIEPAPTNGAAWRPYRGKPFTRAKRRAPQQAEYPIRRFGFKAEIQPSTSSKKMRNPSELAVHNLLTDFGLDPMIEPHALKILRNGTKNGQVGWFVPDFYVLGGEDDSGGIGTYIEVSMGDELSGKLHKIRFVAERYGKLVIHITRDNIQGFLDDPDSLMDLIMKARLEEIDLEVFQDETPENVDVVEAHARLGTTLEPRIRIEKSRKPKKGKRADPRKHREPSNKPSRDLERRVERRALRKKARELGKSIIELRRQAETEIVRIDNVVVKYSVIKAIDSPHDIKWARSERTTTVSKSATRPKPVKSSAGPQRLGDRQKTKLYLATAA